MSFSFLNNCSFSGSFTCAFSFSSSYCVLRFRSPIGCSLAMGARSVCRSCQCSRACLPDGGASAYASKTRKFCRVISFEWADKFLTQLCMSAIFPFWESVIMMLVCCVVTPGDFFRIISLSTAWRVFFSIDHHGINVRVHLPWNPFFFSTKSSGDFFTSPKP
jgi:hypothetical protein